MTALVLGGSSGIGAAAVRALHRDGHRVAVGYRSGRAAAEAMAAELTGVAVGGDVTVEADLVGMFDEAERRLGVLDVVVHAVGEWTFAALSELTAAALEEAWALNLRSVLLTLREASRRLEPGGSVVVISSAAVALAPPRQAVYAAMKAGVEAAVRVAAKELGPRGIRVNAVRPGVTDTPALRRSMSDRAIEAVSAAAVLGRLGRPDDVADAVAYLAGPGARWVTGEVLNAGGGLT